MYNHIDMFCIYGINALSKILQKPPMYTHVHVHVHVHVGTCKMHVSVRQYMYFN